jgi:hypothetical protein
MLLSGLVGGLVGWRLRGGRRERFHTLVRVQTAGAIRQCRVPSDPGIVGVSVGDTVSLWGREHSDGALRVVRIENQTTGVTHRPALVSPWVAPLAVLAVVLILLIIETLGHTAGA